MTSALTIPNASLIVTIVPKGRGEIVLEASVKAGAHGGTVCFGRGAGVNEREKIFGIPIMPEKEIVLTVVYDEPQPILREIVRASRLEEAGAGMAFVIPIKDVVGVAHLLTDVGGAERHRRGEETE